MTADNADGRRISFYLRRMSVRAGQRSAARREDRVRFWLQWPIRHLSPGIGLCYNGGRDRGQTLDTSNLLGGYITENRRFQAHR